MPLKVPVPLRFCTICRRLNEPGDAVDILVTAGSEDGIAVLEGGAELLAVRILCPACQFEESYRMGSDMTEAG